MGTEAIAFLSVAIISVLVGVLTNLLTPTIQGFIQSWALRQQSKTIKIKIGSSEVEVKIDRDMSSDETRALIEKLQKTLQKVEDK